MTAKEIADWDAKVQEELDRALLMPRRNSQRLAEGRKERAPPPTPERISEVSDAVLRRRMDQAAEELKRRRNERSPRRAGQTEAE
jgi:hypothetical protein